MTKNVGKIDRLIRIVVGLVIIAWGFSAHSWWGALGLLPLVTGIVSWCPAYCPIGLSTCCGKDGCSKS